MLFIIVIPNSLEQVHSWDANIYWGSHEILRIVWNPRVRDFSHYSQPSVSGHEQKLIHQLKSVLISSFCLFIEKLRQLLPSCTTAKHILKPACRIFYKCYHWPDIWWGLMLIKALVTQWCWGQQIWESVISITVLEYSKAWFKITGCSRSHYYQLMVRSQSAHS